ncbi:glycoside hydrolase family 28 protein [Marinimicrobium alkaliphilum]|uniref:glycoside hydrolase family 28 protein n=1 Tax=Marinimicrobium alkaliphilum TaxID=2202654 RepID=UPI000DBA5D9D|nr:glycoside hydrolase family 28 protein [Marinimicrobium alkaliphilum]
MSNAFVRASLATLMTAALTVSAFAHAERGHPSTRDDWAKASEIVQAIQPPRIRNQDYVITDFGARSGHRRDARPAILEAIDKAYSEGGGRVVIPSGNWLSEGPIHLKSGINLHVAEGAHLLFSPEPSDYLPAVLTRWEGTEMYGYSPLIYAFEVEDVAITGKGTIDGNKDSVFHTWKPYEPDDLVRIRTMGIEGVPREERQFHEGHFLRPPLIQFFKAKRVLLEDYHATHSPFWINHLVYTDQAIVRRVSVESHFANNDGLDIDSSTYVLVEDNHFDTGDDAFVVKAGRDFDGRQVARPSENIVIRNNVMGGEDGIALGSEMAGGIRNVFVENNRYTHGDAAFRFKSNLDRGGVVEHIRVRNMHIESTDLLFWFELTYAAGSMGGNFPSIYRDIVFEDITVENAGEVFRANAPKGYPLKDVTLRNIRIENADELFIIDNVDNLTFDNVIINGQRVDGNLSWQ